MSARTSALPDPELVSLVDDTTGPYAGSPDGWWTEHGGAVDVRSNVVYFPRLAESPSCPFPCPVCERRKGA